MDERQSSDSQAVHVSTPVMDIQPPKTTTVQPAPAPDTDDMQGTESIGSPSDKVTSVETPDVIKAALAEDSSKQENPLAINDAPLKKQHHTPIAAVLVAVFIALALAGLTVFAYSKYKGQPSTATQPNKVAVSAVKKLTVSDVDQAQEAVDSSLKTIDDSKDFGATDLTDTTLGL